MKDSLTASVLYRILSLAPMGESAAKFKTLADSGDIEGFYRYYESCMRTMPHLDSDIERAGQISFRLPRPAMDAVYMAGRANA